MHDIHCGSKSYKFKFLGKLVVQYNIRASFMIYLTKRRLFVVCMCLCVFPHAVMRTHVREGVGVHNIHCGLKSYKFKFLGVSIVQLLSYGLSQSFLGLHFIVAQMN